MTIDHLSRADAAQAASRHRAEIVDAAVHIWSDPDRIFGPPGVPPHAPNPFTRDMLIEEMNATGVDRAVIVAGLDTVAYALESASVYPDRLAVMAPFDPTASDAVTRILRWREQPGMLGLRLKLFMDFPELTWLREGRFEPIWDAAATARVPIAVRVTDLVSEMGDVARRNPRLTLLIDHVAAVPQKVDEPFVHLPALLELARYDNIHVKMTGLPFHSHESSPYNDLDWIVRELKDSFGTQRLMWGTDLTRMFGDGHTYREVVDQVKQGCTFLSAAEKDAILGANALRILGWE